MTTKTRFRIGNSVQFKGVLAVMYGGTAGWITGIEQNPNGVTRLDQYTVWIPERGERMVWEFQLTPGDADPVPDTVSGPV
jgi:hypothetical protein